MLLGARPRPPEPSFLKTLIATFAPSLLISICFKLIQDLLAFVNPQLLRSPHALSCCSPSLDGGLSGCPSALSPEEGTTCEKNPRPGTERAIPTPCELRRVATPLPQSPHSQSASIYWAHTVCQAPCGRH